MVPDCATVWWFARRHVGPDLLDAALDDTIRRARGDVGRAAQVTPDCTGLFLTYTSRYFEWRAKRHRGQRGWLKWAFTLRIAPRILGEAGNLSRHTADRHGIRGTLGPALPSQPLTARL